MSTEQAKQSIVIALGRSRQQAYKALSLSAVFALVAIAVLFCASIDYLAAVAITCFALALVFFIIFYIKYNYRVGKCPKCSEKLISDTLYKDGRHRIVLKCAACGYEYVTDIDLIP